MDANDLQASMITDRMDTADNSVESMAGATTTLAITGDATIAGDDDVGDDEDEEHGDQSEDYRLNNAMDLGTEARAVGEHGKRSNYKQRFKRVWMNDPLLRGE